MSEQLLLLAAVAGAAAGRELFAWLDRRARRRGAKLTRESDWV